MNQINDDVLKEKLNKAYDCGGADVLKLLNDTVSNLAEQSPQLEPYVNFCLHVIEAVRQELKEVISSPTEESRIIKV
jgi:hypothetical protein